MSISDRVHTFYATNSGEPLALRTLLFLDYDPVLPGWTPEERRRRNRQTPREEV